MLDRSSDKSVRELLIIHLLTMFPLPKGFSWKFSGFHGKEQKATSHTCPTCPWSCLSQNQKGSLSGDLPSSSTHSWPAVFLLAMTGPCKANSSPLCMEMLMRSDHIPSTKLPESHLGSESDLQPISTKLTFKPQPLIEHWVISVCLFAQQFQGHRVCAHWGGANLKILLPTPTLRLIAEGRGLG